MATFDHCSSFEQLANESPIDNVVWLRRISNGNLALAKRIANERMFTASNEMAAKNVRRGRTDRPYSLK